MQPRLEIPVLAPGRRVVTLRRSGARPPLHLARALLGYSHLSMRERISAGRAALALGRLAPDDSRTLGAWLTEHGQSPRAIAALWDLIALPTLNLPAAEASLELGTFVFQQGLLADAAAGDIGLHRAPLQQIIGDPAARALAAAGVTVHLRWPVRRIATIGERFAIVGADSWLGADAVIVAVPHDRAAALLPEPAHCTARPGPERSAPRRLSTCTSSMTAVCSSTVSPQASTRRCSTSSIAPRPAGHSSNTWPCRCPPPRTR